MGKYIVLLRGVNISGKNKISMQELKGKLSKNGYKMGGVSEEPGE